MDCLRPHADGVMIELQVIPRARKTELRGMAGGRLRITVSAVPEDGRANRELIERLCDWLGLRKSQVVLISGHKSRQKRVLVSATSQSELERRLARALANEPG